MPRVVIPFRIPSRNETVGLERTNRYAAAASKKRTQNDIITCLRAQNAPKDIPTPITIQFQFKSKIPTRDLDGWNIKPVLDALVEYGMIPDDNVKYIKRIEMEWSKGEDEITLDIFEYMPLVATSGYLRDVQDSEGSQIPTFSTYRNTP